MTLKLNDVEIYMQNLTSVIGVFLSGPDKEAIIQRHNSFWNWGATSGELEWLTDKLAMFWVHSKGNKDALTKIMHAMVSGAMAELLNADEEDNEQTANLALRVAQERFDKIEWVSWFKSPKFFSHIYGTGQMSAEKETGDFTDVITQQLTKSIAQPTILTANDIDRLDPNEALKENNHEDHFVSIASIGNDNPEQSGNE